MVTSRAYLADGRLGQGLAEVRDEVGRLMSGFIANGAQPVEPAALLPADILIDLYGEDLRARAYTTHDPVEGELMLRPDLRCQLCKSIWRVMRHLHDTRTPDLYGGVKKWAVPPN